MVVGETDASRTANALWTDKPTAATIVRVILGVHASTTTVGLTRGTGACTRRRITVPATALFVIATAVTVRLTCGPSKGRANAAQTQETPKGRGSDGFECLAA